MCRWTVRQLRAFLGWVRREWEKPSLTDHYLMRMMAEMSLKPASPEDFRVTFGNAGDEVTPRQPQRKLTPEQQSAHDKQTSAMWRGMVDSAVTKKDGPKQ